MARKKWMFIGHEDAGEPAVVLMSLIQTCRECDVDPAAYLRDVLVRISETGTAKNIAQLTPKGWKLAADAAERDRLARQAVLNVVSARTRYRAVASGCLRRHVLVSVGRAPSGSAVCRRRRTCPGPKRRRGSPAAPSLRSCPCGTNGDALETIVEIWAPGENEAKARLRLQGLAAPPRFDDVDGDGAPDLTVGTLRTDLLGQLGRDANDLEVQLNVFLLRTGKPKLPAALTWRTHLSPQAAEGARSVAAEFFGDVDGDGTHDLLLHDSARTLRVLRSKRRGDNLRVDPFWHTALPDGARPPIRIPRRPCDDIVIVAKREILHMRFR